MFKGILAGIVLAIVISGIALWQWGSRLTDRLLPKGIELTDLLTEDRLISTPPPLRYGNGGTGTVVLTVDGILTETNRHRAAAGAATLHLNSQLNTAAAAKAADLFQQQYFDHVGPDGRGAADWVEDAGYAFLAVGENLALGNFPDDAALVQAWMNSPGHRANIVSDTFQDIGIGISQGTFEGKPTWIAVQTFALPAAACPAPATVTRTQLAEDKARLESLANDLAADRANIEAMKTQLDSLLAQVRAQTAAGNERIARGNEKIQEGNRVYQATGSREQAQPHWDEGQRLQTEGERLLDEARRLQAEAEALLEDLRARQAAYNARVAEHNQLQQTIKELTETLNNDIRRYNRCVSSFAD